MHNTEEGRKRRHQNACDECRRRKVKCDSATNLGNICTRCQNLKLECTHNLRKQRRGPRVGSQGNPIRNLVNAILSTTTPFVVPDDPERVKEILVDLANHARALERQLSLLRGISIDSETWLSSTCPSPPDCPPEPDERKEVEDSIESLAQELGQVSINHLKRHFGKSSHFWFIQSVVDTRQHLIRDFPIHRAVFYKVQRPEFWFHHPWQQILTPDAPPFVFPDTDLLLGLINLYFVKVNPLFPLLHRPTFERSIADGLHLRNRSFGSILLAICAIAAKHSNDPRTLCEGTTADHSRGWIYFRQIPLMHQTLTDPPSLYDIQLCCAAVYYLYLTSTPDMSWTLIGLGIRYAQELGMHRRRTVHDPAEYELWKRAFWLLISFDVFMSSVCGRPRATTPDDFDLDLPIECDDEYWESADPQKAFVQPDGKPSRLSYFATLMTLLDIFDFAQQSLYSIRKTGLWSKMGVTSNDWKQKSVVELDSALNRFLDQIPSHLKWNPDISDTVFFHQSALLYSTYYWTQIQVHRPFIPRPGHEPVLPFPSLTICSNAARKIVQIAEVVHDRHARGTEILESGSYPLTPLFTAALIRLTNIWRPQIVPKSAVEYEKEMRDVHHCVDLIQTYEERYQSAGRLADILKAVIAIGQLPRPVRSPTGEEHGHAVVPSTSHPWPLCKPHDMIYSENPSHGPITAASDSSDPNDTFHSFDSVLSAVSPQAIPSTSGAINFDTLLSGAHSADPLSEPGGFETMTSTSTHDYMLHQGNMWYSAPENDFAHEDWNAFMLGMDGFVNDAINYRGF
ncbi:Gypsy retrotransposon integrase-like protein 1 [Marasmius tenuissimus]|nr:Gypsy retrotransposon integrase-like protein 1 [Marasmius tenuissimus]